MTKRFEILDAFPFKRAEYTDQGFMRVPVRATRVGVFKYVMPDGTIRRELRPPEEVFSPESMKTLRSVPVTDKHPKEMVNASNAKRLTIGWTTDKVEACDKLYLDTESIITDVSAIKRVEEKKGHEVSCGYSADIEMASGVWEGEHYDAIQRNIRYNHLALVDKGRAGPQVKLRLDADEAVLYNDNINLEPREDSMKVKIGDKEYEMSDEAGKAVMDFMKKKDAEMEKAKKDMEHGEKEKKDAEDKVSELTKKAEKNEAKADAAEAKVGELEGKLEDLKKRNDSATIHELVKERKAIEEKVTSIVGDVEKIDEMDNMDLKKLVVSKALPSVKLEEKSDSYIEASFETITSMEIKTDALAEALNKKEESKEEEKADSLSPEEELMKKTETAYQGK